MYLQRSEVMSLYSVNENRINIQSTTSASDSTDVQYIMYSGLVCLCHTQYVAHPEYAVV